MKTYKNAVSPTLFKRLQHEVLAGSTPWYFSDFTAYENNSPEWTLVGSIWFRKKEQSEVKYLS